MARRIDDPNIYDLYYLARDGDVLGRKKGSVVKLVLRKQETNQYLQKIQECNKNARQCKAMQSNTKQWKAPQESKVKCSSGR